MGDLVQVISFLISGFHVCVNEFFFLGSGHVSS